MGIDRPQTGDIDLRERMRPEFFSNFPSQSALSTRIKPPKRSFFCCGFGTLFPPFRRVDDDNIEIDSATTKRLNESFFVRLGNQKHILK